MSLLNATVVTMNKRRKIFKDGAVVIEENKIIEVGKSKKVNIKKAGGRPGKRPPYEMPGSVRVIKTSSLCFSFV